MPPPRAHVRESRRTEQAGALHHIVYMDPLYNHSAQLPTPPTTHHSSHGGSAYGGSMYSGSMYSGSRYQPTNGSSFYTDTQYAPSRNSLYDATPIATPRRSHRSSRSSNSSHASTIRGTTGFYTTPQELQNRVSHWIQETDRNFRRSNAQDYLDRQPSGNQRRVYDSTRQSVPTMQSNGEYQVGRRNATAGVYDPYNAAQYQASASSNRTYSDAPPRYAVRHQAPGQGSRSGPRYDVRRRRANDSDSDSDSDSD